MLLKSYLKKVAEVDDLPWEAGSGLISMGPLLSKLEVVLLAFEAAVAEIDDLPREAGLISNTCWSSFYRPSCLLLTTSLAMGPLVAVYDEGHLCWSPEIKL